VAKYSRQVRTEGVKRYDVGAEAIRDVLLFPTMRSLDASKNESQKNENR
jgi:hypothetical protein